MNIAARLSAIEKTIKNNNLLYLDMLMDFHQIGLEMDLTVPSAPEEQKRREAIAALPWTPHERYIMKLQTIIMQSRYDIENSHVWRKLAERYDLLNPETAAKIEAEADEVLTRHSWRPRE